MTWNQEEADDTRRPVSHDTSETEWGDSVLTVSEGGRGSCVFLVGWRSFRPLMPVDTPAAPVPLCETLWNVFGDIASHTSWWESSGHLENMLEKWWNKKNKIKYCNKFQIYWKYKSIQRCMLKITFLRVFKFLFPKTFWSSSQKCGSASGKLKITCGVCDP